MPRVEPEQLQLEAAQDEPTTRRRANGHTDVERRRAAAELLETHGALLTRTHLRDLGLERHAVDAVFRRAPTVREAAERWLASRIDVAESTKRNHRSALAAIVPLIGRRRVDSIEQADVADLIATLCKTRRRETVRKMLLALAMIFD